MLFKIAVEEFILRDGGVCLYWMRLIIPSAGCALLFEGRKTILFLSSACTLCIYVPLESLGLGIGILHRKGYDIMGMNMTLNYTVMLLIAFAVTIVLFLLFHKKNKRFPEYAESFYGFIFVLYLVYARIAAYRPWVGSEAADTTAGVILGWNLLKNGIADLVVFLAMVLICILICQSRAMHRLLRLNERCIEEQTEQYRLLSRGDRELRRFRHDYNQHITALQALAGAGELEKLKVYVEDMAALKEKFKFIRTNNIICDAILNQYFVLCRDKGFEMKVNGSFPEKLEITETDLCIVLSNGVKNAYEAAVQCEAGQRKLRIEIIGKGLFVYVLIYNSAVGVPVIENGVFVMTKKDRLNHGLGTQNMIESAERAGGRVRWKYENGTVETEITLKEKV